MVDQDPLREELKKYFSTEEFGVKMPEIRIQGDDDRKAEEIITNTLKYSNGQYEVGLLWKQPNVVMPAVESFNCALKRLKYIESKMQKNPEFAEWYSNTIEEYVAKGYARRLNALEVTSQSRKTFYLPHFAVVNANKNPVKPRLVFDAAAKVQGVSLNSELLTGPDNVESLLGILLRFREGKFAVAGDIREMFSQVRIKEEDQDAQRFLWREGDCNKTMGHYVMQVMTFGATCSPACAHAIKNRNAERFQSKFPRAVKAIVNQHYVDDYLDSFDTKEEAIETTLEVILIHNEAKFELRSIIANDQEILYSFPNNRVTDKNIVRQIMEKDKSEKVLGIHWDTSKDYIGYQVNIIDSETIPSKRKILSNLARIFDPLGLITHLTIGGKILMQEIWKDGTNWDDKISDELMLKWRQWIHNINQAKYLKIPRCYSTRIPEAEKIELHIFVDASEQAFAATAYLRVITCDDVDVCLIAAKSRVAPTRGMSIPRLELQAAVLGVRLGQTITAELRLKLSKQIM